MDQWRTEWQGLVADGKEGGVLLWHFSLRHIVSLPLSILYLGLLISLTWNRWVPDCQYFNAPSSPLIFILVLLLVPPLHYCFPPYFFIFPLPVPGFLHNNVFEPERGRLLICPVFFLHRSGIARITGTTLILALLVYDYYTRSMYMRVHITHRLICLYRSGIWIWIWSS